MAGKALTHYAEAKVADCLLRGATFVGPAQLWIGLDTLPPSDVAGTGTEVTGGSYGRQMITFGPGVDQGASGRLYANSNPIVWATATANWGTINSFSVYDAPNAGNRIFTDAMPGTPTILSGMTPSLPVGAVTYLQD